VTKDQMTIIKMAALINIGNNVPKTPEEWWEKNRDRFRGMTEYDRDKRLELVFEIWETVNRVQSS
jgi:hypothetical protein